MAEIERIAQELRALGKRPLPATEDQIKALVTLAERDRPLTLSVNSEAVAKLIVGRVEQQAKAFEAVCDSLIKLVDDRTDYLNEQLTAQVAALQRTETKLAATIQRIPSEVAVNWLKQWKVTALVALGPVVLVLLGMLFTGHFSRVPKEELEKVQAELAHSQDVVQRFQQCRVSLVKERPELAYKYFPYNNDPKPAPAKKGGQGVRR
jgi:hypothetical protein